MGTYRIRMQLPDAALCPEYCVFSLPGFSFPSLFLILHLSSLICLFWGNFLQIILKCQPVILVLSTVSALFFLFNRPWQGKSSESHGGRAGFSGVPLLLIRSCGCSDAGTAKPWAKEAKMGDALDKRHLQKPRLWLDLSKNPTPSVQHEFHFSISNLPARLGSPGCQSAVVHRI